MSKQAPSQYTIRGVPPSVDRALRRLAKQTGRSLNEVALEALAKGVGEPARAPLDLSFLVGTLSEEEATRFDAEISSQRTIDRELW